MAYSDPYKWEHRIHVHDDGTISRTYAAIDRGYSKDTERLISQQAFSKALIRRPTACFLVVEVDGQALAWENKHGVR